MPQSVHPRDEVEPRTDPLTVSRKRRVRLEHWGYGLASVWVILAAIATALDLGFVQRIERQMQSLFFEIRGPVTPPGDVVILAIDEASLEQGQYYAADPSGNAELELIQSWPWQRAAYAVVIERLLEAGAKVVSLDVVFSAPSSYGPEDDQRLLQTLQRYPERVVLAAQYAENDTSQGFTTRVLGVSSTLRTPEQQVGLINYPIEPDDKIHRFGEALIAQLLRTPLPAGAVEALQQQLALLPTFADATLEAAQIKRPAPSVNSGIFFYGPAGTFPQISFWSVLVPQSWQTLKDNGTFQDKIVLIGSTATLHRDFHMTPFAGSWAYPESMPGVEIHANAIASQLNQKSLIAIIPNPYGQGVVIAIGGALALWLLSKPKQPLRRWAWGMGIAVGWWVIAFILFYQGQWLVPTATPVGAIALCAFSQLFVGSAKEQYQRRQLRDTLKQYATSPVVKEIISRQDDLQDLLRERELAMYGTILGGRYRLISILGSGGFSETFVAQDTQRPGNPLCVVKQLKVTSSHPDKLKLARRLFRTEAEALERLGQHEHIPQLMAFFEEQYEFYLVEELIAGHPLSRELLPNRSLSEQRVVAMLYEILQILEFVHNQGIIHRDLKPSNIIRRQSDERLILIDFGVAKQITTEIETSETKFTVGVGTPGYMPHEQSAGKPQFSSDLYALGMIAIEALTGESPHSLRFGDDGELLWTHKVESLSPELQDFILRLVRQDHTQRFPTAQDAREALEQVPLFADVIDLFNLMVRDRIEPASDEPREDDLETKPWPDQWTDQTVNE